MELAFLLICLAGLLALGVPVAFALGSASLATFFLLDIPAIVAFQRMAAGMNVFTLMAIPFFVFAGDLMARTGIAERLVKVAEAAFGRAPKRSFRKAVYRRVSRLNGLRTLAP